MREAPEPTQLPPPSSSETVQQKPAVASTTPSPQPATSAAACVCDSSSSSDGSCECFRSSRPVLPPPTPEGHSTHASFFQGEGALGSPARRSFSARCSAAVAFFFSSSSSQLCTATVSDPPQLTPASCSCLTVTSVCVLLQE